MKKSIFIVSVILGLYSCKSAVKQQTVLEESLSTTDEGVKPLIWEIVSTDTSQTFNDSLNTFLVNQKLEDFELKKWKWHYILYGKTKNVKAVDSLLKHNFSNTYIKKYDNLYYNFNRLSCNNDTSSVKEWRNYILTANLVNDQQQQKAYMDYHANQFSEWPEVAQGFCNASFQQLIMFRNDRQLMLVISVPKNKTLEELDPKTIENNPRVVEWNKIMAKYQEGIPGTKPNETWVMLADAK